MLGRDWVAMSLEPKEIAKAAGFVLLCLAAGAIGSVFTFPSLAPWYATLNKPAFTPPDWVFGPVWTTLYVLMGIAAYLVYREGAGKKEAAGAGKVSAALALFGVQLALNVLWSFLFFGLRSPLYGLAGIIALWFAILFTVMKFYGISKTAALLLAPYLVWVSFAGVLNFYVLAMN